MASELGKEEGISGITMGRQVEERRTVAQVPLRKNSGVLSLVNESLVDEGARSLDADQRSAMIRHHHITRIWELEPETVTMCHWQSLYGCLCCRTWRSTSARRRWRTATPSWPAPAAWCRYPFVALKLVFLMVQFDIPHQQRKCRLHPHRRARRRVQMRCWFT